LAITGVTAVLAMLVIYAYIASLGLALLGLGLPLLAVLTRHGLAFLRRERARIGAFAGRCRRATGRCRAGRPVGSVRCGSW
jgi:hypothetical protein